MKLSLLICLILGLSVQLNCWAQEPVLSNADSTFLNAQKSAFSGKYEIARDSLNNLLNKYPKYTDAKILLAKTYSWDNNYAEARKYFNRFTSANKENKEAWIAAIKNEIYAKNHPTALGLTNKAERYLGEDKDLEKLKTTIFENIANENLIYSKLKEEHLAKKDSNAISLKSSGELFNRIFDEMYYASIQYQRKTSIGVIIPRINYSNRFNIEGLQYELDVYPRYSKSLHGYINYAYSNAPTFPEHKGGLEIYKDLPKAKEISLGARYLGFLDNNTYIFTGSYGMYKGNYYFSARPYVSLVENNPLGLSGTVLARKYFKDGNNYFGINIGYGFNSELNQFIVNGNLISETLLFIESQNLRLEYQFTDKSSNNRYMSFLSLTRQGLPFETDGYVWSVRLGLQYTLAF